MAVSAVSAQMNQAASAVSSQTTSNASTTVTSSDPTILANQEKQITNQIMTLQGKNGSSQQIQKLQLTLQMIKNKIQQQKLAEEKKASSQSSQPSHTEISSHQNSSPRSNFSRGIDIRA